MEKTNNNNNKIKFCDKLNTNLAYTHQKIKKDYGDSTLSYSQDSRRLFKNGREKKWRVGHALDQQKWSSTSKSGENISRVPDLLSSNRPMDNRMRPDPLNIPKNLVIVHDIIYNNWFGCCTTTTLPATPLCT